MIDRRKVIYTLRNVYQNIKDSLESTKGREFLIFLFFFFVAGAFWLLQTLNDEYETEITVPVQLKNVPDNIVITSEPTSELHIKVKDKGTVLLNYRLSKNFFPVTLDYNDYRGTNNRVRVLAPEYEREIQRQLNASTRLLSINPDTLEYIYATGIAKSVPVKFNGRAVAGREYYITDTIFSPDSVIVYAPSSILDTIKAAYIEEVFLEDISDTLKTDAPLISIHGAKFLPNTTKLTLPVDIYTEKTVEVPIYGINFPADKVLRTFPSKVQVTFKLGISRYKEVTGDFLSINISYKDLIQLGTDKYTVELNNLPEGLSVIRITPPQIDFLIEQVSK
ncbi:CdaR family protein [Bacteroides sp. 519]|uniref:CdaR family protein n=1 Tax=Bacteroides sp. 519 TaxID=2302937 RepID=UPI0013D00924|nr:YbbR-like domain-containing protein [Bacteroides sp. 519]NDV57098.1 YbbR-like domain-containing protein [Bacteroides sp. 519]